LSGTWKLVLGLIGWGLAGYAVLSLGQLPGEFGHSLCGPWGCLPPLQALAAMHLFWALALLPLIVLALAKGQPHHLRLAGMLLSLGAGLGIAVVVGRDLLAWLPAVPPEFHGYWARRALYTLVTLSDVPLLQVLGAGAICWSVGHRRLRRMARPAEERQASRDGACRSL
jgi:hypothetical protein